MFFPFNNLVLSLILVFETLCVSFATSNIIFKRGNMCELSDVIVQLLNSADCVDIWTDQRYSETSCVIDKINKFKITFVFWTSESHVLSTCPNNFFFFNNSSRFLNRHFLGDKYTARFRKIVIITHNTFIPDEINYKDLFGFARVVVVSNNSVHILDSPLLKVRNFKKLSDHDKIWPGIETKDYIRNGTLRSATFDCSLFTILNNKSVDPTGIEVEIVKELARQLNLKIQLILPKKSNILNNFGYKLKNGTWHGGLMGALYNNEADIAFCSLWMAVDRDKDVEQITPWGKVDLTFLVPRPHVKHEYWFTIFLPFRVLTWAAIFSALILASIFHWLLLKIADKRSINSSKLSYISVLLHMFGALTQSTSAVGNRCHSSWLVSSWFLVCLVLSAAFSSNIASRLTLPVFSPRIDTVQQLVEEGYKWGHSIVMDISMLFNPEDPWQRRFMSNFKQMTDEEIHKNLISGKFAYPVQALGNYYVFSSDFYNISDHQLEGLRKMKDVTREYHVSIAIRRGSPLFPVWNLRMQRLLGAGIVDYWKRRITLTHGRKHVQELFLEKDLPILSKSEKLKFERFQGAFVVLTIGLIFSVVCFICEFLPVIIRMK